MGVGLPTTWWHDLCDIVVPFKILPQSRSEFHFGTQHSPVTSCIYNSYSHAINASGGSASLSNIKRSLSLTLVWLAEVTNTMLSWQSSMPKPIIWDKKQWFRNLYPKFINFPPKKNAITGNFLVTGSEEVKAGKKYFLLKLYNA